MSLVYAMYMFCYLTLQHTLSHTHTHSLYSDLFPTFGDVFVLADNNSTLELDTLTITYSAFQPEAALLANFTVLVDTSFTTSENAIVHITNTDTWLVVEEPSVDLELSLSDRSVNFYMTYSTHIMYNFTLQTGGCWIFHALQCDTGVQL